jgi:uncharacterized protein with GYD domain
MVRFLALLTFTEKGLHEVQQSCKRADEFRAAVENAKGNVIAQYWAVGDVDGCVVFEVPDEEVAAALLLRLGRAGNVRTRSLRVYNEQEFGRIVTKA